MTCHEQSERMPAVARGNAAWTLAEAEHLSRCADCRAEWALVMAGAAVAGNATLDVEALATKVLSRLRTEPVAPRRRPFRWVVGLAAAASVVLVLSRGSPPASLPPGPAVPPLGVDLPGLDGLGTSELQTVLESVDAPWTETSTADAPSLNDLTDQELARVARGWEN